MGDQALRALHRAHNLAGGRGLSSAAYRRLRRDRDPSAYALTKQYGSWHAVIAAAGLPRTYSVDNPRYSDEMIYRRTREAMDDYACATGKEPTDMTYSWYGSWWREKRYIDAASGGQIKIRFNMRWRTLLRHIYDKTRGSSCS